MSEPTQGIRQFVTNSYQLISASTPTVPLQGSDLSLGILILNQLLLAYAANGLMLTISEKVDFLLTIGQGTITSGEPDYVPSPDITSPGRLVNLSNAWVTLSGVTYPLIDESRTEFWSSYKYAPLAGLPRYIIIQPNTNLTTIQVFPAPSQPYLLSIYGKWQQGTLTSNSDLSSLPTYYQRFLQFALARDLSLYKGRAQAWTDRLEQTYMEAKADMEAASQQNLDININQESWLNGAWRVRAGV